MIDKNILAQICDEDIDDIEKVNKIKKYLHSVSFHKKQPVDLVQWVPVDKVEANNYNPNSVARTEMKLLYTSIKHDGYTQPVVTIYDDKRDKYVIVDGFHRSLVGKTQKDIQEETGGCIPVVVIDKPINDRMASTIRHNRARGKHSIDGMSSIVFKMLDNGWSEQAICNELGMEAEEVIRLKHITGFSKLFENEEYKKAWTTKNQIWLEQQYNSQKDSRPDWAENPDYVAGELNKQLNERNKQNYAKA